MLRSINPSTDVLIKEYKETSDSKLDEILSKAENAFALWSETPFEVREKLFLKAASILLERKSELARLMALEMGKPITQGEGEVEKCAWVCRYYAEKAREFLKDEFVKTDATKSFVTFNPLGVVLAVMPWNFPFWQVFRFAAPALMAGNVGVLKHASNVSGCALAIEDIFKEAGFPDGVFNVLLIGSSKVEKIIKDKRIAAVTLTGSTPAGRAVASAAGSALKKTVMELGGSDPYVILKDADLNIAVSACASGRMINGGQSCIAAKRFIVIKDILEDFKNRLLEEMKKYSPSDPLDPSTMLGPMAKKELRDELHEQVLKSIEMGAKVLLGGTVPEGPGAFYPPTVLDKVKKGMPAFDEELFGPVASIIEAEDEEHAFALANDSSFGLGAAVFTSDISKGEYIASKLLKAGSCFVNAFVRSDPRLPFGGVKESGYGRELGRYGILEFVNIKTVYVA